MTEAFNPEQDFTDAEVFTNALGALCDKVLATDLEANPGEGMRLLAETIFLMSQMDEVRPETTTQDQIDKMELWTATLVERMQ